MVLLSRRHSLETGRNCTKTTMRRMNQYLSPRNSPSMNKQVFVLGGRSECGHQGQRCTDSLSNSKTRHQATLCSSPTYTGGYSDIIFTDRLLGNLKKRDKHTTNNPQAPTKHGQHERGTKCIKQKNYYPRKII